MKAGITLILLFTLALILASGVFFISRSSSVELLQSRFYQFFLPTFRSFRKALDFPYLVYKPFPTDLPLYELALSTRDIDTLNKALPDDPIKGRLTEDRKQTTVKAYFREGNFLTEVDVRYRGWEPNHWNAMKKSYFLKFPNEEPFHGFKEISLIIPEDRNYAAEPLNIYRAKKMGLLAPEPWFVNFKLNGQDMGVYFVIPHWDKNLLESNKIQDSSNLFTAADLSNEAQKQINFFDPKNIDLWKDSAKNAETNPQQKKALGDFFGLVYNSPDPIFDKTIESALNMDDFYSWAIINQLVSSSHQSSRNNVVFLRSSADGKISPVAWDVGTFKPGPILFEENPLVGRVLSIPRFREEYLKRLKAYVSNPDNLKDDLKYYDELTAKIKIPLYQDLTKQPLNYQVGNDISRYRNLIIENFSYVKNALEKNEHAKLFSGIPKTNIDSRYELPEFYSALTQSRDAFVRNNNEFRIADVETLALGPGNFTFLKDVILPSDVHLEIMPGTTVSMGEGASLVVLNKLTAKGAERAPITIQKAGSQPWGSFLILGKANETNEIEYLKISGGSGFHGFGFVHTGMLAFAGKGAKTSIKNSSFANSFDDDLLNLKYGVVEIENNTFHDSYSDAIDLDVSSGNISNNIFTDIGFRQTDKPPVLDGDAIDLSFSSMEAENNIVLKCADKGFSIGEVSQINLKENFVYGCNYGISSKDLSEARISRAYLFANRAAGLEIKEKKSRYGIGHAWLKDSLLWNNKEDIIVEEGSKLEEDSNNILQSRNPTLPDFKTILPPKFYEILQSFKI
ncbi:CotH kinase family protein [Candidatus Giovannonibacteria bacterium]|nr:CotH kinase family protein [Candidatus Giovannonibacteria bacterium]